MPFLRKDVFYRHFNCLGINLRTISFANMVT